MLGTVTALHRYPVKSMLGEDLDASDVSHFGLARDRRLAVVSRRTGKVASAKYPRLWRDLFTLSAEALDDAARITLPDGKIVCSTDADIDEVLSALLNEPVTLTATPPPGASLDRAVPRPDPRRQRRPGQGGVSGFRAVAAARRIVPAPPIVARRHGATPSISVSSEKLRKVLITTISPST